MTTPATCSSNKQHDLAVTLSADLTVEFPHKSWASKFLKLVKRSHHSEMCHPHQKKPRYVRLNLPKNVINQVQFRKVSGADDGYGLVFSSEPEVLAEAWVKGLVDLGLWKVDPRGEKIFLPLTWTHEEFDFALKKAGTRYEIAREDDSENVKWGADWSEENAAAGEYQPTPPIFPRIIDVMPPELLEEVCKRAQGSRDVTKLESRIEKHRPTQPNIPRVVDMTSLQSSEQACRKAHRSGGNWKGRAKRSGEKSSKALIKKRIGRFLT